MGAIADARTFCKVSSVFIGDFQFSFIGIQPERSVAGWSQQKIAVSALSVWKRTSPDGYNWLDRDRGIWINFLPRDLRKQYENRH
jgi:hypothetical protein